MEQCGWFYRTFICGHWFSGQIKVQTVKTFQSGRRMVVKTKRYRECQKCGKRVFID